MSAALVDAAERIKESMTENEDSSALVYCRYFKILDISHSFNFLNKIVSKTLNIDI